MSAELVAADERVAEETEQMVTYHEQTVSSAEALERCPVLGSMPVEQANVLLELNAMSDEMFEDEVAQTEEQTTVKHEDIVEDKPEPAKTVINTPPSEIAAVEHIVHQEDTTPKKVSEVASSVEEVETPVQENEVAHVIEPQIPEPAIEQLNAENEAIAVQPKEYMDDVASAEPAPKLSTGHTVQPAESIEAPKVEVATYQSAPQSYEATEIPTPDLESKIQAIEAEEPKDIVEILEVSVPEFEISAEPLPEAQTEIAPIEIVSDTADESVSVIEPVDIIDTSSVVTESMSDAKDVQPASVAVEQMSERGELTEAQQEQAVELVVVLPEEVQEALVDYAEVTEPIAIEQLDAMVVQISEAASELHSLVANETVEATEVEALEEKITITYKKLLSKLDVKFDESKITQIIESIKQESFKLSDEQKLEINLDKGTHEQKFSNLASLADLREELRKLIGRFAIQQIA